MQIFRETLKLYRDTTLDFVDCVLIGRNRIMREDVLPFYKNINREGIQLWKAA